MNDFKDCYQSAVKDLGILGMKEFHMDASQCMDEGRHNRRVVRRMSRSALWIWHGKSGRVFGECDKSAGVGI